MPEYQIKANSRHDAGAYARCSCGVYSLDYTAIGLGGAAPPACPKCGKRDHWCGSFEPPGPDAEFYPIDGSPYDTEITDHPTCPHCGEADQDWWDCCPPKSDGDRWDVDCPFCERPYTVTMYVSTNFSTEKPPPAAGKTIIHSCADPRYFLRMNDTDLLAALPGTCSKANTLAEVREQLRKDSEAGIVYPIGEPCEGFDRFTGCPGHKTT